MNGNRYVQVISKLHRALGPTYSLVRNVFVEIGRGRRRSCTVRKHILNCMIVHLKRRGMAVKMFIELFDQSQYILTFVLRFPFLLKL